MAGFADYDSAGTHKFSFTLDGIESKSIKQVDGLTMKLDKVETKSVTHDGKAVHKAWAGNKVYLGTLTVTRVMTDDSTWDEWFKTAVKDVKAARKNGHISILNQEGMPIREYIFTNAWPTEVKVTGTNASTANPIEETVTFVYEELASS
jgi:phage tail-like protein